MSLTHDQGKHVHFPAKSDKFEFDSEVATIFDSMAVRSIPMYAEVHRVHAEMFASRFCKGAVVVDVGASTGNFFASIELQKGRRLQDLGMYAAAIDPSVHIMNELADRYPTVNTLVGDVGEMPDLPQPADVISCFYVLQFMRGPQRARAVGWLARNLAPNGVLLLGQKDAAPYRMAAPFQEGYHAFRRRNGYSQTEIDAKTAALANSMWTISSAELTAEMRHHNLMYIETSRWLQFSSGVASHWG